MCAYADILLESPNFSIVTYLRKEDEPHSFFIFVESRTMSSTQIYLLDGNEEDDSNILKFSLIYGIMLAMTVKGKGTSFAHLFSILNCLLHVLATLYYLVFKTNTYDKY